MTRRITIFRRCALLLGLMVWLLGSLAQQIHLAAVVHVVCADHGEVVEIDRGHAHAAVDDRAAGPRLEAPVDGPAHEHGCDLDDALRFALAAPDASHALPAPRALVQRRLSLPVGAPRGPPLAFAPKTSPPHATL